MRDCRRLVSRRRRRPGMTGATASSSLMRESVEAPVWRPAEAPAWMPAAEVAVLQAVEAAVPAAVVRVLEDFAPRSLSYLESLHLRHLQYRVQIRISSLRRVSHR